MTQVTISPIFVTSSARRKVQTGNHNVRISVMNGQALQQISTIRLLTLAQYHLESLHLRPISFDENRKIITLN